MRKRYQVALGVTIALAWAFSLWETQKSYGRAKNYTTGQNLADTSRALQAFKYNVGRCPTSAEGPGALLKQPENVGNWKGPYIRSEQLQDAWGHQFIYRQPARMRPVPYELFSAGPDGIPGDGDDIFPDEKLFAK